MGRKIGKMVITTFTVGMLLTNCCFAAGIGDSQLATGTENLIKDVTNWLLILAPILTACLVGYYWIRKGASDEMDSKRWDGRIKTAIISCIGVILTSGLINIIIGYFRA